MIKDNERLEYTDEDESHWEPWIIKMKVYAGQKLVHMTKDQIETLIFHTLGRTGLVDLARHYNIDIIHEEDILGK